MFKNKYYIGIEREGLKCTKDGCLANTVNSKLFEDVGKNSFMGTDFGEAQLEFRTPVCENVTECYDKLENITDMAINEIRKNGEMIWPYSMPCIIPADDKILYKTKEEEEYDAALFKRYSKEMFYMSGIHVNFSIDKSFYKEMKKIDKKLPENLDDAYIKIMNAFVKKAWILTYLFGAAPVQFGENSYRCKHSIRNSYKQGFKNSKLLDIDLTNKQTYINSIKENIKAGYIASTRELYIPMRAKIASRANAHDFELEELEKNGINHIEARIFDLNPFDKCGISKAQMGFIIAFMFNCLVDENIEYKDYRTVAEQGISDDDYLIIKEEIKKVELVNNKFELELTKSIKEVEKDFEENKNYALKVEKFINENGYIDGLIKLASKYSEDAYTHLYSVKDKNKTICSVTAAIIKDALSAGINYKVIEGRPFDSFVAFIKGDHIEYIHGGTRTRKDTYIFPYLTNDKYFAKDLMRKNKIVVPDGILLTNKKSIKDQENLYSKFYNKTCVVKPRTTNGGTGITVFSTPVSKQILKKAIQYAFKFDDNVIVENYLQGNEYRLVVIDGKCTSAVLRRSASVVGDGKKTIKELMEIKDKEPWHYFLNCRMVIDEPLKYFLLSQNLTLDSIPKEGERVFLRENSNCSTGGESINVTDQIPEKLKKIAEKTAKIFNAKICGIDMIINDLSKAKYGIIEINEDPGYDLNEWPYEGKEAKIGLQILQMLGF